MSNSWKIWVVAILFTLCVPALAQDDDDALEAKMREAERRLVESEQQMAEAQRDMERQRADRERLIRDENVEVEIRMREAEAALAEAAQHVAELSRQNLPRLAMKERIDRPMLGISIGRGDSNGPVEGVTILGVSPGGAAEEAGLRAGDVIISMNGETLTAESEREAQRKLLDFMKGVEEGDELEVGYLRNGKTETVKMEPRPMPSVFAFSFDGNDMTVEDLPFGPRPHRFGNRFVWLGGDGGFGDMEMVKLTERLGRYFGTSEGILIVRAPENEELKLEDGDVILSIDGRKPTSVHHGMRILGSYQNGETVKIEIMRDKRKQTVSIDIPDNRQSFVAPLLAPKVHAGPGVRMVPPPGERM